MIECPKAASEATVESSGQRLRPGDGVHVAPVFRVLGAQIFGSLFDRSNLAREGDVDDADKAVGLDELDEIVEVAIVGAVVEEGIDGDHCVEEVLGEGGACRRRFGCSNET